jgi:methyl-accepting chemotaxis protein
MTITASSIEDSAKRMDNFVNKIEDIQKLASSNKEEAEVAARVAKNTKELADEMTQMLSEFKTK